MTILIDATTTQDELKSNGVGVYSKGVIQSLIEQFPNTIFKLLMFDSPSTLDEFLKKKRRNVFRVSLGKFRSNNFLNPLWFALFFRPIISREIDSDSVYFCPYFWRSFPVRKLPVVVTIHDFALAKFNIYSQQSFFHNFIRKIEYWLEMRRTTKANALITDAQFTKQDYLEYFPKYPSSKILPIHLGIDMQEKDGDISKYLSEDWKENGYFIYLGGGVTRNKNSEAVLHSYAQFLRKVSGSKKIPDLVIAGKNFVDMRNPDIRTLHLLVESLGLRDKVFFIGMYEDSERFALLKNSVGFLHLSLFEGFGFSVVEAMRSGTPVIVHNGSCYPEVVGDGGLLVDGNNYDEVSDAMEKVFMDEKWAKQVGRNGKEKSLKYTWKQTALQTHEVFEKVLKNSIM